MKQILIICAMLGIITMSNGQIYKYREPKGQGALGVLMIVGGAALTGVGAVWTADGIREAFDFNDDDYYEENLSWKAGTSAMLFGIGLIWFGVEKIKNGTVGMPESRIHFKIDARSVGVALNF